MNRACSLSCGQFPRPQHRHHRCLDRHRGSLWLALDKLGYRVFAGVRNPADGTTLAASASPRLMPIGLDITDSASIAAAVHTVRAMGGEDGLAGLVNNAGIAIAGPLEALPLSEWRGHSTSCFRTDRGHTSIPPAAATGARPRHQHGFDSRPCRHAVHGSLLGLDHALEGLNDSLRVELQPWGIHVALIEPGTIATPNWGKTRNAVDACDAGWNPEMRTMYHEAFTRVKDAPHRPDRTLLRQASLSGQSYTR